MAALLYLTFLKIKLKLKIRQAKKQARKVKQVMADIKGKLAEAGYDWQTF